MTTRRKAETMGAGTDIAPCIPDHEISDSQHQTPTIIQPAIAWPDKPLEISTAKRSVYATQWKAAKAYANGGVRGLLGAPMSRILPLGEDRRKRSPAVVEMILGLEDLSR